jgi:hypothetical protein
MKTKLLVWFVLGASIGLLAAAPAGTQAQGSGDETVPQVAPLKNYTSTPQPQSLPQVIPGQGDHDPDLDAATDKPRAGAPLPSGNATPNSAIQTPQPYQTPEWYKATPQPYDHAQTHPRPHVAKPQAQRQLALNSNAPSKPKSNLQPSPKANAQPREEIAAAGQEPTPQQQEAMPQDDGGQVQGVYTPPAPQYSPQPAPQQYPAQPPPRYYQPPAQQVPHYSTPPQQRGYGAPPAQDYGEQYGPAPDDYGDQTPAPARPPVSPAQLEQLVAPIALYPDTLVAQILTAATYPAQLVAADQWLRQMQGASQDEIAAGATAQSSWDPSIKALTSVPEVLDMLAGSLQWTTDLGNAYYNQQQDVLETVQEMRGRAEQAGNLQSTPQEQVTEEPGYTEIAPANPEYVYVPSYNPWMVYGQPVAPYPGFYFPGVMSAWIGSGVRFGLGFGMGAFMHTPFGLMAWGLDWMGHSILFHHDTYWTHSREVHDWGFAHGGRRWDGGRGGFGSRENQGREIARFDDRIGNGYRHEPIPVHPGQGLGGGGTGRGLASGGPARPEAPRLQVYGRTPEGFAHPQPFGGRVPGYGQGYGGPRTPARPEPFRAQPEPWRGGPQTPMQPRPGFGAGPRPGFGYGAPQGFRPPQQVYRPPQQTYRPPQQMYRPPEQAYRSPQQSGGFHPFGGGRSAPNYGGGHAFAGGHSFGGSGHAFAGGGHSFGGGGHSSGGGHGGGGHSGGGHHR